MTFILKKTFCYETIAEALAIISDKVVVWEDQITLREIIDTYKEDLYFIGVYSECRPSTLRMLEDKKVKSFLIHHEPIKERSQYLKTLNLFTDSKDGELINLFWPYFKFPEQDLNSTYYADISVLYDLDYGPVVKKIMSMLLDDTKKINTYGSMKWPTLYHRGPISELGQIQVINSSKKILLPIWADKRYIIKTLSHNGKVMIIDDQFNELTLDEGAYTRYSSKEFIKILGKHL